MRLFGLRGCFELRSVVGVSAVMMVGMRFAALLLRLIH